MGCVDTRPDQFQKQRITNFQGGLIIKKDRQENKTKRQDLTLSDYDAFLKKSKQQGRTDYPSVFKLIKITSISDSQILKTPKEDIPALNCTRNQLINLAVQIIYQNSFSKANLNKGHLQQLITEIAHHYNDVSYHNFTHGFSFMQMLYRCFKTDLSLGKIYSDQELTYYLLASITHDVNHKGTNNDYEVKLNSELALAAQNDAVLQKMHLRTFLQICQKKPEFDIISKSTNPQKSKQKIARIILATDMAKHKIHLEKITKYRTENKLNFKDEEIKIQFMENLAHGCDISNGLLSPQEYYNWGSILTYQFHQQTKLQAQNNIAVTEFFKYKGVSAFCGGQLFFLGTFVQPLWKELCTNFPALKKLADNIDVNIIKTKELKEKEEKQKK